MTKLMILMRLVCGITAHRVLVEWDVNGFINVYHASDLKVVDESRELKPGHKLDVGGVVKPGE